MSRKTRILILGGGFAGVEVARVLERLLEPQRRGDSSREQGQLSSVHAHAA